MAETKLTIFKKDLALMSPDFKRALPAHMTIDRFIRIVETAVSLTPKLLDCDRKSLVSSIMLSSQLGLEPNTPTQQSFLIPRGGKVQFELGYRGMLTLVRRSNEIKSIFAELVYENDDFKMSLGSGRSIHHEVPRPTDRGKFVLVYSMAIFTNGQEDFNWMSAEEIEEVIKALPRNKQNQISKAWRTSRSEMVKKTVMKRHTKTLPVSESIMNQIATDGTFKQEFAEDMTEHQEGETEKETIVMASDEDKKTVLADAEKAKVKFTPDEMTLIKGDDITKDELYLMLDKKLAAAITKQSGKKESEDEPF